MRFRPAEFPRSIPAIRKWADVPVGMSTMGNGLCRHSEKQGKYIMFNKWRWF